MSNEPQEKTAPSIGLPRSDSTCRVSIIDSQCDIVVPPHFLVEPNIKGHEWLNLPTYAFHITHEKSGQQVLFDFGGRKDWENYVPAIAAIPEKKVPGWKVGDGVGNILTRGGVKLEDIKALILSHWHFDHSGDLSTLPQHTDLVVGPGFKEAFLPGYPSNQSSPFWEADFEGRNVVELPFSDNLKIGKFQAHDYFGDGSLYILNVPGHTTGHISALVRTTPDTAIFMGGDVCHFTGMVRPSEYKPFPDVVPSETKLDPHMPTLCPCAAFTHLHPNQAESRTTPFYKPSSAPASFYDDVATAEESIRALAEFDADPNILLVIAHDPVPKDVCLFFPNGDINDWHAKHYKNNMFWSFLNEMPYEGKTHRQPLVDGVYKDGKKIKDLYDPYQA